MNRCRASPHVAHFVEEFQEADFTYLVTKYEQGSDLIDYMERRGSARFEEQEARGLVEKIALGLKHIHGLGIVHRDIKFGNILVSSHRNIKIADFGLSIDLKTKKSTRKFSGTLSFMAPEVIEGRKSNTKADIWSLGVILYAMINGNVPFGSPNHTRF